MLRESMTMRTARFTALGCAALLGLAATVAAPAGASAAKCAKVSGEGTGLTADIAKALATDGLNLSIANYGGKGKGKVAMKCDGMEVLATCKATQRACK